ncbi:ZN831 protein, partial [Turnix velox]|nr:ZN831 protein [Turnix velox]
SVITPPAAGENAGLKWDRGGVCPPHVLKKPPHVLKEPPPALQDEQHPQHTTETPVYFCHSLGHAVTTHCKEFPAPPHSDVTCQAGTSTAASTRGTFPSLHTEPQLTWCCLKRSLPRSAEQKGSTDSAYSSMHICDRGPSSECTSSKYDISILKMKNTSKAVASRSLKTLVSSSSKGHQWQELSSAAPGGAFRNISEQRKKTVVC